MHSPTRRAFMQTAIGAGIGLVAASEGNAIEPVKRSAERAHLKLSLAAYSFRKYLNLQAKPKPEMTLEDFVDVAASYGLDAVEPTSYYFADSSQEYMARLKGRCTRLGLDVSGTAVGNDFCVPDADKMKEQLAMVRKWVENVSILGGKAVRIFAGRVARGDTEEKALSRCVDAIGQACDHAGKYGVYLALENHGGITATCDQILGIVKRVEHPWFAVNLDTGNFHTADPYADLARLAPYAVTVQIKTEIQREGKQKEEADLKKLIDILRDVRYRGYVALEYEAAEEPRVAIPRYLDALKKLIAS